jgi:hypothetical protein
MDYKLKNLELFLLMAQAECVGTVYTDTGQIDQVGIVGRSYFSRYESLRRIILSCVLAIRPGLGYAVPGVDSTTPTRSHPT